jgi:hypothetical protein
VFELDRSPTCPHSAIDFCAVLALGRLVAPMDFMNAIGDLLPIALRGLTSLWSLRHASSFSLASPKLMKQWAFRHSARSRPLNASMKALSVGLLGREKSRMTSLAQAHKSRSRETNSLR